MSKGNATNAKQVNSSWVYPVRYRYKYGDAKHVSGIKNPCNPPGIAIRKSPPRYHRREKRGPKEGTNLNECLRNAHTKYEPLC